MPIVDLRTDPRAFAILDDACNSTCHTRAWAKKAQESLAQYGHKLGHLKEHSKTYKGIGAAKCPGSRTVPWCLSTKKGNTIEGEIKSNELEKNDEVYMLLSLRAQASLGFVKDVEAGTCYLKGYKDHCQLYQVAGSGLRAVCISDFPPERANEEVTDVVKNEDQKHPESSSSTRGSKEVPAGKQPEKTNPPLPKWVARTAVKSGSKVIVPEPPPPPKRTAAKSGSKVSTGNATT